MTRHNLCGNARSNEHRPVRVDHHLARNPQGLVERARFNRADNNARRALFFCAQLNCGALMVGLLGIYRLDQCQT